MVKTSEHTPVMQQYLRAKEQYPDAILFFRMGDFYEMFFDDAVVGSRVLDITLTSRSKSKSGAEIPMAGVPHHSATSYIARLLDHGHKVALCEQLEDPSKTKGLVARDVVRVMTPGLVLDPEVLPSHADNYVVAVVPIAASGTVGASALELSRSELGVAHFDDTAALLSYLVRLDPREVLLCRSTSLSEDDVLRLLPRAALRVVDHKPEQELLERARVAVQGVALDLGSLPAASQSAVAMVLDYAARAQPGSPLRLSRVVQEDPRTHLVMEESAIQHLELVRTLSGERKGSLLDVLDETETSFGSRLLRRRLLSPLTDVDAIRRRHDAVEWFVRQSAVRQKFRDALSEVLDLERLVTRVTHGVASARDLVSIRQSLKAIGQAVTVLQQGLAQNPEIQSDRQQLSLLPKDPVMLPHDVCDDIQTLLEAALVDEPIAAQQTTRIFRASYDPRLQELYALTEQSEQLLLDIEQRERKRTGIPSLKVRYTRVFGYFIEVTRTHLASVPSEYRRKQTIAGGERYTTDELDDLHARVSEAQEQLAKVEAELFDGLRGQVARACHRLDILVDRIADLDVHSGLADVAHRYGYTRPAVEQSVRLQLQDARHPVIERLMPAGSFVPNSVSLHADGVRMMMITGPNMAGKSTIMRQVALCVILAQAGSFVPARSALIGVVDKVYTRVGASDNLGQGQSTFMVEMRETAAILKGATARSLVVVDEIGRGTSTYDGLAIAWSVAEWLADAVQCRTLFATHYHELCELATRRPAVGNFNVTALEESGSVTFLHKLMPGASNRSFGIAVARLAGLPPAVVQRAETLLKRLEGGEPISS
jgi:DNA mismatch repair protein MutS